MRNAVRKVKEMHRSTAVNVARQTRSATAALLLNVGSSIAAPRMLTASEVCEYLRVSRATLYRLLRDRNIPAFRVSKRDWRVAVDDLAQWVERESRALEIDKKAVSC
jgi:excisionase family DNA binding protein